jgi:CubicO group peptidase (beta-lactamase class C family)
MRGLWQLAISASATLDLSLKGEVSNCALLGPQYPMPEGLSTSSIINDMKAVFSKLVDEAISTKKTPWGPIELVNTSFSVGVFSIDSDEFLYEFHHHGPGLDGTLTGEALDNGTLYRIGSITKLLTVYTLLVKLGPSYWSQPIVKFIPELADAPDDDPVHHVKWSGVTLGALAGQMSGIARDSVLPSATISPSRVLMDHQMVSPT